MQPTKLTSEQAKALMDTIPGWGMASDGLAIARTFFFDDFKKAVAFVDRVAVVAEEQNHHPDLRIQYDKVRVKLSTHDVGGLSVKDFDLAVRINELEK